MEVLVYNPAAAVQTVSRQSGNTTNCAKNVDTTVARISQLSLMRAANGNPNLSAETQAAIASGKVLPPTIQQPEEASASESESMVKGSKEVNSSVSIDLSPQARKFLRNGSAVDVASLSGETLPSVKIDIQV